MTIASTTDPLTLLQSGKVRELYDAGDGRLLMVASDRISAFDVIMAEPIPDKGRVLTAMTVYWLDELADLAPSHLISADPADFPAGAAALPGGPRRPGRPLDAGAPGRDAPHRVHRARLPGRVGLEGVRAIGDRARHAPARRAAPGRPAARAHLHAVDQGHRGPRPQHRDRRGRRPGGQGDGRGGAGPVPGRLPAGRGPRPRRTASSSATPSSSSASSTGSCPSATRCSPPTRRASGRPTTARPGTNPPSFDKQPLRDWLESQPWDKKPPPPALPDEVVAATSRGTSSAYERICGRLAGRLVRCLSDGDVTLRGAGRGPAAPRDRRPAGRHHRAGPARTRIRRGRPACGWARPSASRSRPPTRPTRWPRPPWWPSACWPTRSSRSRR